MNKSFRGSKENKSPISWAFLVYVPHFVIKDCSIFVFLSTVAGFLVLLWCLAQILS